MSLRALSKKALSKRCDHIRFQELITKELDKFTKVLISILINDELPVFKLWGWGELKWKCWKVSENRNFP